MSTDDHIWSTPSLLIKARLYVQRSTDAEPGSGLFAFWSLMAFEFLARAAVASVHPALLADPRDGQHLLFAFGYGKPENPKSVTANTVLLRCQNVVAGFTAVEVRHATGLMNLRNGEVHSGSSALEDLSSSGWLPQFYRLSEILLTHLQFGLADLFSPDQAATARQIIDSTAQDVESEVKQRIADCRKAFELLAKDEQQRRHNEGAPEMLIQIGHMSVADCPACSTRGLINGEISDYGAPKVGESDIELSATVLPTSFSCSGCGLKLSSHAEMLSASLGDQYTHVVNEDPVDFYGIDIADRIGEVMADDDYGND